MPSRVFLPLLGQAHAAAKVSTAAAAEQGIADQREKVAEMVPPQTGHLAPVARVACSTNILLDYLVLLGAAKVTHTRLCPSSGFLLQQWVFAVERGMGNGDLENTMAMARKGAGMTIGTALAFHTATLPGVTNHSLAAWCQLRSQILVPTPWTASTSCRLTAPRFSTSCNTLSLFQSGTIAPSCVT